MTSYPWISSKDDYILLLVFIQAGAKSCEILGEYAGRLKIRLNAKPIDGQANARLLEFLSKTLKISKTSLKILSGETAKYKSIGIFGQNKSVDYFYALLNAS